MFLVLLIHYVPTRGDITPQSLASDFWDTVLSLELKSISFVCVNCFVLISGYFGIRWRIKSFAGLIFQIFFWLIAGVLVYKYVFRGDISNWLSVGWNFLSLRWFISAYICLYVLAPLINSFIENSTQKQLAYYILIFYLFSTLYGYFMLAKEFNEGMSAISLIGIYLTGAYLRRYKIRLTSFSSLSDLAIYFGLGILLVLGSILLLKTGFSKSIYGYLNPIIILESVYLFLFFEKLRIGYVKWINYVAASAFAVYLFHIHPYLYGEFQSACRYINSSFSCSLLMGLVFFVLIFTTSVLVDRIRIICFNTIYDRIDAMKTNTSKAEQ